MTRSLTAIAALLVSSVLYAQSIKSCDASNDFPGHRWRISCLFAQGVDESSLAGLKAYVLDAEAASVLPSVLAEKTRDNFDLEPQQALDQSRTYFVFVLGVTVKGQAPDNMLNAKVAFQVSARADGGTGAGAGPGAASSTAKQETMLQNVFSKIEGADSKEKSDLYFSGTIWAVGGQDWSWAGSVDLKIQRPFSIGNSRFDHQIGPSLTLQSSNDPSADPDTLKYGVQWSARLIGIHGRFKGMFAKEELRMESTRDFTDRNFISDTRFTFALPTLASASKTRHGYLEPFLGVEAGKNIQAPLLQVDGTGRARPLAGVSFALAFTSIPHLHAISITTDYVRRWPLQAELGYQADSKNVLHLTSVGTAPKDKLTSKINFMFNDWLGAYFGHEYGSEPPSFKLVDNKLSTGLLIQAKFGSSKASAK